MMVSVKPLDPTAVICFGDPNHQSARAVHFEETSNNTAYSILLMAAHIGLLKDFGIEAQPKFEKSE